jgi:hypothetical protein
MTKGKTREDRVRRELGKGGLALSKMPSRFWLRDFYYPGYMILEGNVVVSGASQRKYEDTLQHVEWYAFERLANHVNNGAE